MRRSFCLALILFPALLGVAQIQSASGVPACNPPWFVGGSTRSGSAGPHDVAGESGNVERRRLDAERPQ